MSDNPTDRDSDDAAIKSGRSTKQNESQENDLRAESAKPQETDQRDRTLSKADGVITPGVQIGSYKVLSVLGEGGFGIVYLAKQEKPIERRVALKVIKPGMDSKQVIARFEAERQALAVMDHPGIAKVLDGGTTPSDSARPGSPYFVMELIKGDPITEFCDTNRLTIQERMEMFVHVCEAVQHAHSKGVIHRDLKPSNVLVAYVDGRPSPKIIDFGVAKALNQRLGEHTLFTMRGQMVGTPEYMSPEQAEMSAVDIDTRSDVYALGVMLYELLTGTLPFESETLRSAGMAEVQRIIREVDPPKPSARLHTTSIKSSDAAAQLIRARRIELQALERILRGELDWIILKSLEKSRSRRYATAAELGEEVSRYLHGDLVQARPPSLAYRSQKLIQRHRHAVVAIITFLILLVGATIVSTLFAFRTEQALSVAETARQRAETAESELSKQLLDARKKLIDFALMRAQLSVPQRPTFGFDHTDKLVGYLSEAKRETDALMAQGTDRRIDTATQILLALVHIQNQARTSSIYLQRSVFLIACDARQTIKTSLSEKAMHETYVNSPDEESVTVMEAIQRWDEAFLDCVVWSGRRDFRVIDDPEVIAEGRRMLTEMRAWQENSSLSSTRELLSLLLGEMSMPRAMVITRCIELLSVEGFGEGVHDRALALQLAWQLLENGTPDVIQILDSMGSVSRQIMIRLPGVDDSIDVFTCKAASYAVQGDLEKACASLDQVFSSVGKSRYPSLSLIVLNRMIELLTQPENRSVSALSSILEHIGSPQTVERLASSVADGQSMQPGDALLEAVHLLALIPVEIEPSELARPDVAISLISQAINQNDENHQDGAEQFLPILQTCRRLFSDRGDQTRFHQALDIAVFLAENDDSAFMQNIYDLISDLAVAERNTEAHRLGVRYMEECASQLEQAPDDPTNLGRLARPLLTIAVKDLRDVERGLKLADRSVHLLEAEGANTNENESKASLHNRKLATALDTLALAYFENGHPDEAHRTQKRALVLFDKTKGLYENAMRSKDLRAQMRSQEEDRRAEMRSRLQQYKQAVENPPAR